ERLDTDDSPDLVIIQVYITNARRSYELVDLYRARGVHVCLGGLHVTSLPEEAAAHAGLPRILIGFESLSTQNLVATNKSQNHHYRETINRLSDLGIMVNGSFVFGLDADGPDVFERTVEWAVSSGLTTATFHIATPYPGTAYHQELAAAGRILHQDWERYDTRHAVFRPANMTVGQLEAGYRRSYEQFYTWRNIAASAGRHDDRNHALRHFAYAAGWKRFEPAWNYLIKAGQLNRMLPPLETILAGKGQPRTLAEPTGLDLDEQPRGPDQGGAGRGTGATGGQAPRNHCCTLGVSVRSQSAISRG
ncbi:MAG: hypothetical protein GY713_09480, partial [Actinomycetia bacterium]|nr:hypothetical protein [Actinomycetes bacterium]